MRFHRQMGLAGIPGVALDERDRRFLASQFRRGGLAGLGASCTNCSPDTSKNVAGAVADTLGLPQLADAARDDSVPFPVAQATTLASATMQALTKLKTDIVATLAGATSPAFAKTVAKTATKLRAQMPANKALESALVVCYTSGSIDAAAGRNTPLAQGFTAARAKLADALRSVNHPDAERMLAGLGIEPGTYATAATYATSGGFNASQTVSTYYERDPDAFGDAVGMPTATNWAAPVASGAPVYLSSPQYYYPKPRIGVRVGDLGTATTPPDEVVIVDPSAVVAWLQYLQSTKVREQRLATITAGNPGNGFDHNARLLAAWVYRQLSEDHIKKIYVLWGDLDADEKIKEKSRNRISEAFVAGCYGLGINKTDRGGDLSAAEQRIVQLLLTARAAALQRTGQIGVYGSEGVWVAGSTGDQQYPYNAIEDAQAYISANFRTLKAKPSAARVAFASRHYRLSYRKEPTVSAMNWYGSFLYPIDEGSWFSGALQEEKYAARIGKLESVRMAGSAPPPEDLVDNSNIFMQLFSSLGPGLGWVLDKINEGVKYATEALCGMFKTLMGPEVGGVMCAIFTAIIKIIAGGIKAAIGAIVSLGKAIAGAIGNLVQGKWLEAATSFFVGVNTAVIFLMGGPFADLLGVPFLKSEERDSGGLTKAISLERMGEELTREDPLFLVNLTLAVIGAIVAKFTPASVGALMVALAPLVGLILAPTLFTEINKSTDPALAKYKNLSLSAIASAVSAITKLIAAIVVGALSVGGFVAAIGAELQKFAEREGGAGAALVKSLQFFVSNLAGQLTTVIGSVAQQPFNLQALLDSLWQLLMGFLLLIPVFAAQAGFSERGQKEALSVSQISIQAAGQASTIAKTLKKQIDFQTANPSVPATLPGGSATTCAAGAGGKVVETKYIARTQTVTETDWLVVGLVGVGALVLGVLVGSKK